MDFGQSLGGISELFEAQTHIYRHILYYINSMVLNTALELGIPDIIHNHQKPITLHELVSKLNLSVDKTLHFQRLMRLLTHSNFFSVIKFHDEEGEDEKEGYVLTVSSKMLLKNSSENLPNLPNLLPFVSLMVDPSCVTTFQSLGRWLGRNEPTAFETAHGTSIWEFAKKNPIVNKLFNDSMASNSEMMKLVVKENKEIFDGVDSIVDVGGGTGNNAKILLEAFPWLKCTVFDLPHVIADMVETTSIKYVGGDMFHYIPSTDVIVLKNVLHDWNDEEALKILARCREAIAIAPSKGTKGKVIIIEMVISDSHDQDSHEITETKLIFDILSMAFTTGKERTRDEWGKLFLQANFNQYKITHNSGLMSIIELFP